MIPRQVAPSGNGATVTVTEPERLLLRELGVTLSAVVEGVDAQTRPDEIVGRLFPRAYEDPLDQMEFADAMTSELARTKSDQLGKFLDSLDASRPRTIRVPRDLDRQDHKHSEETVEITVAEMTLDPGLISAWLAVLQDARQMLASSLSIKDASDMDRLDHSTDEAAMLMEYLGWLLEGLVRVTLGAWPEQHDGGG